jgi:hypothetical protein
MTEDVERLLKAVPKESRFSNIMQAISSQEIDLITCVSVSNIASEFLNFAAIYNSRRNHLLKNGIEHYGFLESIESVRMHHGLMRTARLQTPRFNIVVWLEPDLTKIIGLMAVAKSVGDKVGNKGDRHEWH